MELLPQFRGMEIVQKNVGGGHRYFVADYPCGTCHRCRKDQKCMGLPSVTSFSGQWGGGGLYPAGFRHALDAIFGEWKDKAAKNETDMSSGWLFDGSGTPDLIGPMHLEPVEDQSVMMGRPSSKEMFDSGMQNFGAYLRKEVESFPTPGEVARDFGTGVHKSLEEILRGDEEAEIPAEYANAVSAVLTWLEKGGSDGPYIVEDTEVNVFHPELLIGGQIDCIARIGNRPVIIDWKSGRDIYPNHAIQIAAYAMCYEAITGEEVAEAWVVKSGLHGFAAKRVEDLAPAQKAFIALKEVKQNIDLIQFV